MNEIVERLLRECYGDSDAGSVLALIVFSLGKVAVERVSTTVGTAWRHALNPTCSQKSLNAFLRRSYTNLAVLSIT